MHFQTAYEMTRGVCVCVCVCVCVGKRDHERSCVFLAVQDVTDIHHCSYSIGQS